MKDLDLLSLAGILICVVASLIVMLLMIGGTNQHHTRINWLAAHPEAGAHVLQLRDYDAVRRYIDAEIEKERP